MNKITALCLIEKELKRTDITDREKVHNTIKICEKLTNEIIGISLLHSKSIMDL